MSTLYNELKMLVETKPFYYMHALKQNQYKYLYDYIVEKTPLLNDSIYTIATRVYWVLNNITTFPICPICGSSYGINQNVKSVNIGYRNKTCSNISCHRQLATHKSKNTCLEKYGVEYVSQVQSIKDKMQTTLLNNYGVTSPLKNNNILQKAQEIKENKYGNKNFNNREKAKQTCLEKYGVENTSQLNETKEKAKQTCLEKYGVENYSKSLLFKQKYFNTKHLKFINKIQTNPFVEYIDTKDIFLLSTKYKNEKTKWKCKKCNTVFEYAYNPNFYVRYGIPARCPVCYPLNNGTSNLEKEICLFLTNYNIKYETNIRNIISPLELDIYIPEKKLAIEFDGLYWHSELNKEKEYHLNKTELCEEQGIQLIHIFEDEWENKQEIVKSRLKNLLGIYDNIVYARNCEVKIVDKNISKQFQNENHIQGSVNATVNLGLYYNNELISLMTFGKSRFNKKYEYELLRFCNKLGYHIPGSASKLLKYFERTYNPKSLISYADRRWSRGNVYEKLGFNLIGKSKPNYWYFKLTSNIRYSRINFQKHKLKNILEKFDKTLSESENMKLNGYNRIYDCGNLVYIKTMN